MNCQAARDRMLGLECVDRPPPPVQEHLASCPRCRQWQRRLTELEGQVPLLAVPPSRGPDPLLQRLAAAARPAARPPATADWPDLPVGPHLDARQHPSAPLPAPGTNGRGWRQVARGKFLPRPWNSAALIAASFLLLVFAWSALRPPRPDLARARPVRPADPLHARLMTCDLNHAVADTTPERLRGLADLAHELFGETRALAQTTAPKDLRDLARLYGKVVRDGLVASARELPDAGRGELLRPILHRLRQADEDARKLAGTGPGADRGPFAQIAAAARDGERELGRLAGGLTP